jgi:hypothetical protein
MTNKALLASALALGLAVPALAQESSDRARLDDFAVPQVETGPAIEQVDEGASRIGLEQGTANDRQLTVPGPARPAREPLSQLSRPDEGGTTRQLSDPAQSRDVAAGSVSSSRDSRPQPTAALAGTDRCDPQAGSEQPDCARILERRAAEFAAAEPPRLSAEQVLLAESSEDEGALAASSSRVRLRLASSDHPDADLQSNQELAAIYLRRASEQPQQQPEQSAPADDSALAQVLQTLQIDVAGPSAP